MPEDKICPDAIESQSWEQRRKTSLLSLPLFVQIQVHFLPFFLLLPYLSKILGKVEITDELLSALKNEVINAF